MEEPITLKRSPVIVIRNFIAIELLAFFAYWLLTGHGPYKSQIYSQTFLVNVLSYDTAKLLFLSAVQLAITIYAFLEWYYEAYAIKADSISHRRGVFFKRERTFPLEKSMGLTISSGPLGKLLHYGSIRIENPHHNSILLKTISRPKIYLKIIKRRMDQELDKEGFTKPDIRQLASQDEYEKLEFKSSLRFDRKTGQLNRDLEKTAMKTVAAFLNSKGGYLVIGLNNERKPLGLEKDYETLQHKDSDGFENHFTQVFNVMIGPEFRHLVKVWFEKMENRDVCIIQVAPSSMPVYLKLNDDEHFYVRTGNITTTLKFSEVESYKRAHWPRKTNR